MYASIKDKKLPAVPRPETKPIYNRRMYGEGARIHEAKPQIPSHMEIHEQAAKAHDRASRARARLMGKTEKRHDEIARLASEGLSSAEISEITGYKPDSVRRLISKMRREGREIPMRKKGRKSEKNL